MPDLLPEAETEDLNEPAARKVIELAGDKTPKKLKGRSKYWPDKNPRSAGMVEGPLPPQAGNIVEAASTIQKPLREKGLKQPFPSNLKAWSSVKIVEKLDSLTNDLEKLLEGVAPRNKYTIDGKDWTPTRSRRKLKFNKEVVVNEVENFDREKVQERHEIDPLENWADSELPLYAMRTYPYLFNTKVDKDKLSKVYSTMQTRKVKALNPEGFLKELHLATGESSCLSRSTRV